MIFYISYNVIIGLLQSLDENGLYLCAVKTEVDLRSLAGRILKVGLNVTRKTI